MSDLNDQSTDVSLHSASDNTQQIEMYYDAADAKYRVPVETVITDDDSPTKYTLATDYDATGVSVGTSDVTLFSYSGGSGVIDFMATSAGNSTYEIAIYTDTVERLRITMSALGSDLAVANATNVPLWAETANKNFRWNPPTQVGFESSFKLVARSTTGSNTIKHLVMYRTK